MRFPILFCYEEEVVEVFAVQWITYLSPSELKPVEKYIQVLERDQNTNLIADRLEIMPWNPSCLSIFSLLLSLVELTGLRKISWTFPGLLYGEAKGWRRNIRRLWKERYKKNGLQMPNDPFFYLTNQINWESANCFYKGPDSKHFRLWGHMVFIVTA